MLGRSTTFDCACNRLNQFRFSDTVRNPTFPDCRKVSWKSPAKLVEISFVRRCTVLRNNKYKDCTGLNAYFAMRNIIVNIQVGKVCFKKSTSTVSCLYHELQRELKLLNILHKLVDSCVKLRNKPNICWVHDTSRVQAHRV